MGSLNPAIIWMRAVCRIKADKLPGAKSIEGMDLETIYQKFPDIKDFMQYFDGPLTFRFKIPVFLSCLDTQNVSEVSEAKKNTLEMLWNLPLQGMPGNVALEFEEWRAEQKIKAMESVDVEF